MRSLFLLVCLFVMLASNTHAEPCDLNNLLPEACSFETLNLDSRAVRFGIVDNNPGEVDGVDPANSLRFGSARFYFASPSFVFDTDLPDCGIGTTSIFNVSSIGSGDQVAFVLAQDFFSISLEPIPRNVLFTWILNCEVVQER